jgi:predicted permease
MDTPREWQREIISGNTKMINWSFIIIAIVSSFITSIAWHYFFARMVSKSSEEINIGERK